MGVKLPTETLARLCARHPWYTIVTWLGIFIIAIFVASRFLGDALTTEFNVTSNPESKRADILLEEGLRGPLKANEIVIVQSNTLKVDAPAFQSYVEKLYSDIAALGNAIIENGTNYYQSRDESLVSADRHTTIMPLIMAGTLDKATENIDQVHQLVRQVDGQNGFHALMTGAATAADDFEETSEKDLQAGEAFGIPIALVILVLAFGAMAAAVIPLLLALTSIGLALGVTALIGLAFDLSFFVTNMITMIGLAVGIDYSLFIVSRFREERSRGLEKMEAIGKAGATASRTVLFSGLTVVLALMGMLIVPDTTFRSVAAGAILVAIASVLAALTLLPAVLRLMGDRVNSLRVPFIQRTQERFDEQGRGGFWDRVARAVMARPVASLLVAAGLLIAAAVPSLDLNPGFNGVATLPDHLQSKEGFLILEKEFSFGLVTPAEIVIKGDLSSPSVQAGIQRLRATLEADPAFAGPAHLQVNAAGDLGLLSIPVVGDPDGQEAIATIKNLRRQTIPQVFSDVSAQVLVTGQTGRDIDFFSLAETYWPIVFAFVLALSFVLLTLVFRSLVVPTKAIIMNLLSVGAAYGLIVLVFQKGVGAELVGFHQSDVIEAWLPLFLFSVLFGLSMDYHVFLLSRVREHYDQTGNNTEAVAFGLRSTGRLITGAALIMVAVFGAFASGDLPPLQQMGFGLAVAVFLDVTIVRSVLVPASMKLLGSANWYLPKALAWLPDLRVEEARASPVTASSD